jgi:pimeloyl-ACP methyl ester carboxylesterase
MLTASQPSDAAAMPTVVALHCSGAGAYEWRQLTRVMGQRFRMAAPDLIGCGTTDHWSGTHAFTVADESARVVDIVDAAEGPVHLVGHSYGGGVALRVARERPTRIASLTLYEPVAFHVLKTAGPAGHAAFEEIMELAGRVDRAVLCGAFFAAAEIFVDHWNGAGSFAAMDPHAQSLVARYIPKACLEFRAMAQETTSIGAYRRFNFPTLLMVGEHTTEPVRLIARQLAKAMKLCSMRTVFGAGHMGPFTHATAVNAMIADHIVRADPGMEASVALPAIRLAA